MKFCVVGGLQIVVLRFEFHQNRLSGFGAVGGRNLPIPIDLAIRLYNSLYYRTSRDDKSLNLCMLSPPRDDGTVFSPEFFHLHSLICCIYSPAHVVWWLDHLGAMCHGSRV